MSNCLSGQAHQFIKFPEEREDIRTTENFFDIAGFPNILGAADSSLVLIKSPGIEEEYNFICKKGYHAINVQGICDANNKFLNIVAKWPGSTHDSFIRSDCGEGWLLGTLHVLQTLTCLP